MKTLCAASSLQSKRESKETGREAPQRQAEVEAPLGSGPGAEGGLHTPSLGLGHTALRLSLLSPACSCGFPP